MLLAMCSLYSLIFTPYGYSAMTDLLALPQFKSKEEQQLLERQALQGSPEIADKIVSIFGLVESNDVYNWAVIAAENGSSKGAYNLANIVSDPTRLTYEPYGKFMRDRQWYWLKKSADQGYVHAINELEAEFPDKEKVYLESEAEIKQWKLSQKSLPKFKRAAMRGSPKAAYRLYQHYSSFASEQEEGMLWAVIAAQNGHPKAPLVVGKLMLRSNNQHERMRSQFWLRKATTAGDKEAAKLLEKYFPGGERP